jgi:hypothetical protein
VLFANYSNTPATVNSQSIASGDPNNSFSGAWFCLTPGNTTPVPEMAGSLNYIPAHSLCSEPILLNVPNGVADDTTAGVSIANMPSAKYRETDFTFNITTNTTANYSVRGGYFLETY